MATAWLQRQKAQVFYSTHAFRCLLDSAARPGKLNQLAYPDFWGAPPAYRARTQATDQPLNLYALGLLLSLLDSEVSFRVGANGQWLEEADPVVSWIGLRSGANLASPHEVSFGLFCDGASGGLLTSFNQGDLVTPEASATIFYCVEHLTDQPVDQPAERRAVQPTSQDFEPNGAGLTLELTGPGIQTHRRVTIIGLERQEIGLIQATRQQYPLGIDVFMVDKAGRCLGLPRTTRLAIIDT